MGEIANNVTVERMWDGGPQRCFSPIPFSSAIPFTKQGQKIYAGAYVCDSCNKPCAGLYQKYGGWHCGTCVPNLKQLKSPSTRAQHAVAVPAVVPNHQPNLIPLRTLKRIKITE